MHPILLAVLLLSAIDDGPAAPAVYEISAYREAAAKSGRDADAQVKLALWCEARGLKPERLRHLAAAVMADPSHAAARGLLGLVAYRGRWERPDAVGEAARADAALAEYEVRRAATPETADAHMRLAAWCESMGLAGEAVAHYTRAIRIDPSRDAAWRKLGYRKHAGRWATEPQVAAAKAEAEAQVAADRRWRPLLARYHEDLRSTSPARARDAEAALAAVTDPRAVPAIVAAFDRGDAARLKLAVQLLGQVDAASASRALASIAVSARPPEARRAATETLKRRDAREYADLLIGRLRDPIKFEVRPVGGPGSPGVLFIEGQKVNVRRVYAPPEAPTLTPMPGDRLGFDADGLPVISRATGVLGTTGMYYVSDPLYRTQQSAAGMAVMAADLKHAGFNARLAAMGSMFLQQNAFTAPVGQPGEVEAAIARNVFETGRPLRDTTRMSFATSQRAEIPVGRMQVDAANAAAVAAQQLALDVRSIEAYNRPIVASNAKAAAVLEAAIGRGPGQDRRSWTTWWVDQLGYRLAMTEDDTKATVVEQVPLAYTPQATVNFTSDVIGVSGRISCFGAGTLVRTLAGPRPIETLKVGDLALTSEIRTGALGYKPVVAVHHNPPSPTILVRLGGDPIVSSPFHRFWKVGVGWAMARDLKAGDLLRTLDGPALVRSTEAGPVQPVFNLDIADDHDFYAGTTAALVHDNTLPDLRLVPFDAATGPILAGLKTK